MVSQRHRVWTGATDRRIIHVMMIRTVIAVVFVAAGTVSAQPRVYVSNEQSGDVSVIDTIEQRVVSTIPVGRHPRGICIRSDGQVVYVALSGSPVIPPGVDRNTRSPDMGSDGIGVIDVENGELRETIAGGADPAGVSLGKDEQLLYVSNVGTGVGGPGRGTVSIVDLRDRKVLETIAAGGEPEGLAVSPDGKWVYLACPGTNEVCVIDLEQRTVATRFKTPARPRQVAFHPKGTQAYVTCEGGSCVTVVDVTKHKPTKDIRPEGKPVRPAGIVVSPDGTRAYVTTGATKSVLVISTGGHEVIGTIADVGARPWGIGITPDGKTLYTANGPSNDVSVIDVETKTVTSRIPAGRSPRGIAVSRDQEES